MKFIKEHKITSIVIMIFVVVMVLLFVIWTMFFSNAGNPVYGNRLEGITEVAISSDEESKISSELKKDKSVKDVSTNIAGRTLDIVITVNDDISIADAKKIGTNSYKTLSEKQISYYSIQVFIKKDDEKQNNFPIIGYKQRETKDLVWTKDREVTKQNESK